MSLRSTHQILGFCKWQAPIWGKCRQLRGHLDILLVHIHITSSLNLLQPVTCPGSAVEEGWEEGSMCATSATHTSVLFVKVMCRERCTNTPQYTQGALCLLPPCALPIRRRRGVGCGSKSIHEIQICPGVILMHQICPVTHQGFVLAKR